MSGANRWHSAVVVLLTQGLVHVVCVCVGGGGVYVGVASVGLCWHGGCAVLASYLVILCLVM